MSTELERTKRALERGMITLTAVTQILPEEDDRRLFAKRALADIDNILHPEPEYEEAEVVRWECSDCGHVTTYEQKICQGAVCDGWCNGKGPFIKLTGTIRRPKPQKVERSVSVEVTWESQSFCRALPLSQDSDFHWERLLGKTGTMTFTWTEEGEGK